MYDLLIDRVVDTFAAPGEPERAFLRRVQQADIRLTSTFRTQHRVPSSLYREPEVRAAYLLRYLGHYTFQLADLLLALDGTAAHDLFSRPRLSVVALCGGPCPEAIALATLHAQGDGQRIDVHVLDRNAAHWADCWPIAADIAHSYPGHPDVRITGMEADLHAHGLSSEERSRLSGADVFTAMNCLNELVGGYPSALTRGLAARLDVLPSRALVVATDQAGYRANERGLRLLHDLLGDRDAEILLAELTRARAHEARNHLEVPQRIAWMYNAEDQNIFRVRTRQLRLAAFLN